MWGNGTCNLTSFVVSFLFLHMFIVYTRMAQAMVHISPSAIYIHVHTCRSNESLTTQS